MNQTALLQKAQTGQPLPTTAEISKMLKISKGDAFDFLVGESHDTRNA